MKQRFISLLCMLLLAVFALPLHADDLTVNDGTTTNDYLPFYGYYGDTNGGHYQMIYPEADLADMLNGVIEGMSFYGTSTQSWTGTWDITLMTIDATTLSSFADISAGTVVYHGSLATVSNVMAIEFSSGFSYGGGNLLVDITLASTGNCPKCSWYGVSAPAGSGLYKYSSYGSATQASFLPKTTFDYTPGTPATCPQPGKLLVGEIGENSALLSWSKGGEESSWELVFGDQTMLLTDTFKLVENLQANTQYSASVRAICAVGDSSKVSKASFKTACGAIAITKATPWIENFDSYSNGSFQADCWRNEHTLSTSTNIFSVTSTSNGGNATRQISLPDMDAGNKTMLVLPAMQIPTENEYEFVIDVFRNAADGGTYSKPNEGVRVFVSPTDTIGANAVELAFISRMNSVSDNRNVPAETTTGWYTYGFTIPMSGVCYIILQGESQYGGATYMDNFKVRHLLTCFPVSNVRLDTASVDFTSAAFQWTPWQDEPGWDVAYWRVANPTDTVRLHATEPRVVIEDLNPNERYFFDIQVLTNCGDGDVAEKVTSGRLEFDTKCTVVEPVNDTIHYNPGAYGRQTLPPCYKSYMSKSTYGYPSRWVADYYYGREGGSYYHLYLTSTSGDSVAHTLVFPQSVIGDGMEFSFWARDNSNHAGDSLIIYMNDAPTVDGAFRIAEVKDLSNEYKFYRFAIPDDLAGEMYIMIEGYNRSWLAISEPMVSPKPACLPVGDITMGEITTESVSFSWKTYGEEQNWFAIADLNDGDVTFEDVTPEEGNPVFTLEGLAPATHYEGKIGILAICDPEAEEPLMSRDTAWLALSFNTKCNPMEIAGEFGDTVWTESFEDMAVGEIAAPCWDNVKTSTSGDLWSVVATDPKTGTHSAKISTSSSYRSFVDLTLPVINVPQADEYEFSFVAKRGSYNDTKDSIAVFLSRYPVRDSAKYVGGISSTKMTTTYQTFSMILPEGEWYIILEGSNYYYESYSYPYTTTYGSLYIDDLMIRRLPACRVAKDLKIAEITAKDITLTWTPGNIETAWDVIVAEGSAQDTIHVEGEPSITIDTLRFDTLKTATKYTMTITVLPDCGGEAEEVLTKKISFSTDCEAKTTFPLLYGFERAEGFSTASASVNNNLPACWNNEEIWNSGTGYTGSKGYLWHVNANQHHEGTNSLALPYKLISHTVLGFPKMEFDETKEYEMSFWIYRDKASATSYPKEGFRIFASETNGLDTLTATYLGQASHNYNEATDIMPIEAAAGWYRYSVNIPDGISTCYIYFLGEAKNNSAVFVDDVLFRERVLCAGVSGLKLDASSVTAHSATFAWQKEDEQQAFDVIVNNTDTFYNVVDTFITVTGLQANATQNVKVAVVALCAAGAAVDTLTLQASVTTPCDAYAIPYVEDFEDVPYSYSAYNIPDCWKRHSYSNSYAYVNSSSSSAYAGSKYLYFQGGYKYSSSSNYEGTFVLPEMELPLNELRIKFFYHSSVTSGYYEYGYIMVGVMSDPSDTTTFIPIRQLPQSADYVLANVSLASAPATHKYIAIRYADGDDSGYAYIDNLSVTLIPDCEGATAIEQIVELTTETSAAFKISGSADNGYTVTLRGADTLTFNLTDDTLRLTNLQPSRKYAYEAEVVAQCVKGAAIDTLRENMIFATACVMPVVNKNNAWVEDFNTLTEGIPACWDNSVSTYTTESYKWNYYATGNTGACVRLNSYYPSSGQTNTLATPQIKVDTLAQLSFMCKNPTGGAWSVVISREGKADTIVVASLTGITNWEQRIIDLTSMRGDTITVKFVGISNCGSGDAYMYLDDVTIRPLPSCLPASDIHLVDSLTTATSATIAWTAAEGTDMWNLVIANGADTLVNETVSDTAYTMTGLKLASAYKLNVALVTLCDEEQSVDIARADLNFHTECVAIPDSILPYVENFDSYEATSSAGINPCWVKNTNGTTAYPYPSSTTHYGTSGNSLYFYGYYYYNSYSSTLTDTYSYAALPEFESAINQLQVNFKFYEGSSNIIYVGVMTDPNDVSSFIPVDTISSVGSAQWVDAEVLFDNYTGADGRIAFLCKSTNSSMYAYIDNLEVSKIPACKALKSLSVSKVTRREMDIVWQTKDTTTSDFELVISETELDNAALDAHEKIQVSDTNLYHATGLTRDTHYYIYARANCGADGTGAWSMIAAKTKSLNACEPALVADGTTSNAMAPLYGNWCDHPQKVQSIYPASMLASISGNTISELNYYVSSGGSANWENANFIVRMGITEQQNVSSQYVTTGLQKVYEGNLRVENKQMHIVLDNPYEYNGGNLVVEFELPIKTGYTNCYFLGANETGASRYKYDDYSSPTSGTAQDFLPKVDFIYCYSLDACPAVEEVHAVLTGDGTSSALISWTASTGDYANEYEVFVSKQEIIDFEGIVPTFDHIDSLSVEATGLDAFTDYFFYVRCLCNGEGQDDGSSTWNVATIKTQSACPVVYEPEVEITGKTTATVRWTAGDAEHASSFAYVLSEDELDEDALVSAATIAADTVAVDLTDLSTGTLYHFYVATDCDDSKSPFEHVSFTTPAACPAVADLAVVDSSFNMVTLAWKRGRFGEETQWQVGIVGQEANARLVDDTTAIVFGLEAETAYTFFVKAVCDEENKSAATQIAVHTIVAPGECASIGSGSSTSYYYPSSNYHRYSVSEQIFLPSEINGAGNINSLAFFADGDNEREWSIYMKHVSKSSFSDSYDWVQVSDADLVYEGIVSFAEDEWTSIVLNTPFAYNGQDNLLLVVDDNTGTYELSYVYYKTFSSSSNVTLYYNNDSNNKNPKDNMSSTSGTRSSSRNQVQFCFEPQACPKVTNLQARDITTHEAQITWTPGGSEMEWGMVIATEQLSADSLTKAVADTVDYPRVDLAELIPDQDYHIYVRALCSRFEQSAWAHVNFKTIATCLVPTIAATTEIEAHAAQLNWKENNAGFAGTYAVAYGKAETFDLSNEATFTMLESLADTFVVVSELEANTLYKFAVRSDCAADDFSHWSEAGSFRTDCDAIASFPWKEDFNQQPTGVFADLCWENVHTAGSSTSLWQIGSTSSSPDGSNCLYVSYQNTGNKLVAATPVMNIPAAGEYEVRFKFNRNSYFSTYPNEWLQIWSSASADTIGATKLGSINHGYQGTPVEEASGWYQYTFTIPAEGEQRILLEAVFTDGYSFYIDDVEIRKIPSCFPGSDLHIIDSLTTTTSATMAWSRYASEDTYHLLIKDGADTVVNTLTADTFYVFEDLTPATNFAYSVELSSMCGDEESVDKTMTTLRFATACDVIVVSKDNPQWIETFNALTEGIPVCWDANEGTEDQNHKRYAFESYASGYDGRGLRFDSYSNKYGTNVLATPEIHIDAKAAELSFMVQNPKGGDLTIAVAKVGADKRDTLATGLTSISYWKDKTFDLTAYAGDTIQVFFMATSNWGNGDAYIYLDNVAVNYVLACYEPYDVKLQGVTESGATFVWSDSLATKWEVRAWDDEEQLDSVQVETPTYTLMNLLANHKYNITLEVAAVCEEDEKSPYVTESFSFRTPMSAESAWNLNDKYEADFSDDSEVAAWAIFGEEEASHFVIGTDENALSFNATAALYVTDNDETLAYEYAETGAATMAYRLFHVEEADKAMVITFQRKVGGEVSAKFGAADYGLSFIVPASQDLSVVEHQLMTGEIGITTAEAPEGAIAVGAYVHAEQDTATFFNNWKEIKDTVALPAAGDYKLVFAWQNDDETCVQSPLAIAELSIELIDAETPTSLNETKSVENKAQKIVYRDHLYILRNGRIFTATGQDLKALK